MGTPHVLETPEERVAALVLAVLRIAGPEPELPYYPSVTIQGGDEDTNISGPFGGVRGKPDIPAEYPNARVISADYQAKLAAWNARFTLVFDELRQK